jgi:hypothetical protein
VAPPAGHAWTDDQPLHLVEQTVAKDDPDPQAVACYGLLARRWATGGPCHEETWLRCVDGRPLSALTIQFLDWCCAQLAAQGQEALLLVWDNASWHGSAQVRAWLRAHNRPVKARGVGVRLVACPLPVQSPWLNAMEPRWVHGKRKVAEAGRLLSAEELVDRMYAAFGCPPEAHLRVPDMAA